MDGSEGGDGRVAGKAPEKGEQVVDSFQDLVRDCSLGGGGSPACWEVESIEGLFQVEDALVQNAVGTSDGMFVRWNNFSVLVSTSSDDSILPCCCQSGI